VVEKERTVAARTSAYLSRRKKKNDEKKARGARKRVCVCSFFFAFRCVLLKCTIFYVYKWCLTD